MFPVIWKRLVLLAAVSCTVVIAYHWYAHPIDIIDPPIAIVGTLLAILLGFRVNNAYDRWWEARKIWGAIVNESRSAARLILSFCEGATEDVRRTLVFRQIAFCYALTAHLRQLPVADTIRPFLAANESELLLHRKNIPNGILELQTRHVVQLRNSGLINDWQQQQIEDHIEALTDCMGMCERIKRTVFPYDYAWYTSRLVDVFGLLLPFVIVDSAGWQTVGWTLLLGFTFYSVDRLARTIENPFENRVNDTAMLAISTTIETDLRQMLGNTELPIPVLPINGALM